MDRTDRIRKKTETDSKKKEPTGIDRNRCQILKIIASYIKKFLSQVGYLGANINSYLM